MHNDVFNKVIKQFDENINSHVFLIETNNKDLCLEDVKNTIKKIINADENTANQIDNDIYIEMVIIKNEGKEIKTEQINYLLSKLKIKPKLSDYLFYIIMDSDSLNISSSNKLLKTIEEPENGIIGFLITNNLNSIIPTIKSRCEIIKSNYKNELNTELEFKEEVLRYIHNLEGSDLVDYNIYIMNNDVIENTKELILMVTKIYNYLLDSKYPEGYEEILNFIKFNNNQKAILKKCKYLNELDDIVNSNINKNLLLEKIYIDFRGIKNDTSS